ncbi:MAG: SRPBCC domain-containing protein [Thermoanaerobaculia bacterium]
MIAGASPERAWPFLEEADRLRLWLADRVEIEPGPPLVIRCETSGRGGAVTREYAEVLEQSEPRRLALGFRELDAGWTASTSLIFELTAVDGGCEVMVFQEGFQKLPLSLGLTVWERSRARWTEALAKLSRAAAAMSPG